MGMAAPLTMAASWSSARHSRPADSVPRVLSLSPTVVA